jgi:uncharacterized protein (TIGR02246 family)
MSTTTQSTAPAGSAVSEERLDRIEAHESIRRLVAEYCRGFDKRDIDRFMSVWADDAVWSAGPGHEVTGHGSIRETAEGLWGQFSATHHWSTNSVIDVDGDQATAETDVHAIASAEGGCAQTAATYRDVFRRVQGQWRLARRATDIHRSFPLPDPVD